MSAAPQHRMLTKRMLLVRAELERAELGARIADLRASTQLSSLLGSGFKASTFRGIASTAMYLFRRYPVLGTGLSLLATRMRPRLFKNGVGGLVLATAKWGALALLAWQGWRWWQRHRPPRDEQYR